MQQGRLTRRQFLHVASTGAALVAGGAATALAGCDRDTTAPDRTPGARSPLTVPGTLAAGAAMLTAASGSARFTEHASASAWLFNGMLPGPTLRARRGEHAHIRLHNSVGEPTIVHWHGLLVPERADGHPRYAIDSGASFDYDFPVVQRAGTFWYHPHAHHLTAGQVHRGLSGFFIVADDEEDALGLPSGSREVLLLLQDRDDTASPFAYAPAGHDHLNGLLRDVPFGNGIRRPTLDVSGHRYRFRVLNASSARVFCIGLHTGTPITVIGNDGGLLPSPIEADRVFLGVGERIDFLIDFAAVPAGHRLMLKSLPFTVESGLDGPSPQGMEMDLLEIVRTTGGGIPAQPLPDRLCTIPPLVPGADERTFVLRSTAQGRHEINGLAFDMNRVDERIPLGQSERWIFRNDSSIPHPVHLHGTHFQVSSRSGGRNTVYEYERGWKDTVLLMPLETVEVIVRFDDHRGIFPLHCHNLQHEDMGMMLNVEVY